MRIRFDTKTIHVPRNGKCLEYPAISLGLTTPNSSIIHREVLIDTGQVIPARAGVAVLAAATLVPAHGLLVLASAPDAT